MNRLTLYSDKEDAYVREDLNIICSVFLKHFKDNILSIYITGSFGRGEGSILIAPKFFPISDYDILLICKNKVEGKTLMLAKNEYVSKLGYEKKYFSVDVKAWTFEDLHDLPHNLYGYEICRSHQLLYGQDLISINPMVPSHVLTYETARFLIFNRLKSFVYGFPYDSVKQINPPIEQVFYKYKVCNTIIALVTGILICRGEHKILYSDRVSIFCKLYSKQTLWLDLVNDVFSYKFKPYVVWVPPIEIWYKYNKLVEELFLEFTSLFFNKTVSNITKSISLYWDTKESFSSEYKEEEVVAVSIVFALTLQGIKFDRIKLALTWFKEQGATPGNNVNLWEYARKSFVDQRLKRGRVESGML